MDIPDYSELMRIYNENTLVLTNAINKIVLKPVIYDELEYFEKSG